MGVVLTKLWSWPQKFHAHFTRITVVQPPSWNPASTTGAYSFIGLAMIFSNIPIMESWSAPLLLQHLRVTIRAPLVPHGLSLGFKYDSISMDALATSISLAGCFWWTLKVTWGLSNCRQRHIFSSFVLQVWESLVCHELQMISKLCPPFCLTYLSGVKFCDIHFFQCVWLKLS